MLTLSADSRFSWRGAGPSDEVGTWCYRGNPIVTPDAPGDAERGNVVYRIIEYTGERLTLRRIVLEGNSLPFTLVRSTPVEPNVANTSCAPQGSITVV